MKQSNRKKIIFDPSKLSDDKKKPYSDTIREALCYLLEHEMSLEMVSECERLGWITAGEWNFQGMCKSELAAIYCAIKNILEPK